MWKVLILHASHSLSDERTGSRIKARLSFMRFRGLGLSDAIPDAKTIWTFREALTRATIGDAPAIRVMFLACEVALSKAGFLATGGQIRDATPPGAEAERDEANRTGASVEEFRRSLGAFTILNAMQASRGGGVPSY